MVKEKFKQFVTYLRQKCITHKYDAVNILRKIYDTESNIECELIAYALDQFLQGNALFKSILDVTFTVPLPPPLLFNTRQPSRRTRV